MAHASTASYGSYRLMKLATDTPRNTAIPRNVYNALLFISVGTSTTLMETIPTTKKITVRKRKAKQAFIETPYIIGPLQALPVTIAVR
ncbi:MAG: hypothetical protein HLX50_01235 [Alteromonadaceae bacterium]|nr:hypothetical protein [Alteromonadaceae bacterium]